MSVNANVREPLITRRAVNDRAYQFASCAQSNHVVCTCLRCGAYCIVIDKSYNVLKRLRKITLKRVKEFDRTHWCQDED